MIARTRSRLVGIAFSFLLLFFASAGLADVGTPFVIADGSGKPQYSEVCARGTLGGWLVAWREQNGNFDEYRVMVRRINENGTYGGAAASVCNYQRDVSEPRLAYDLRNDEWVVVWSDTRNMVDSDVTGVYAHRISSGGELLGSGELQVMSSSHNPATNPDVSFVDARSSLIDQVALQPGYLIVWECLDGSSPQNHRIYANKVRKDTGEASGLSLVHFQAFVLDGSADFPVSHQSFNPRISDFSPEEVREQSGHFDYTPISQVVFEVDNSSTRDIYLVQVTNQSVSAVSRVTHTQYSSTNATLPQVAWSAVANRDLVAFLREDYMVKALRGQILSLSSGAIGGELPISYCSTGYSLDAHPSNDTYFLTSAYSGNGFGYRIAGRTLNPLFTSIPYRDDPALALSRATGNQYLLAEDDLGVTPSRILGRIDSGTWSGTNHWPLAVPWAPASEVREGAIFQLDGSDSHDVDGDVLRYRWSQVETGPAADFPPGSDDEMSPWLIAPRLNGAPSATMTFQLEVDDWRSFPEFPSSNLVTVTVVPADDPNPPVANAGPDQTVDEDQEVELNGSGSYDPDGESFTYLWECLSVDPPSFGPASIILSDPSSSNPSFITPRFASKTGMATVEFKVKVSSTRGGTSSDTVLIHINDSINEPPEASINLGGPWQEAFHALDATASSDPNGDAITCQWEFLGGLALPGETVSIDGESEFSTWAQFVLFANRQLSFRCTVTDSHGVSDSETITVPVSALPMVVDETYFPQKGIVGTKITFHGSKLQTVRNVTMGGYPADFKIESPLELSVWVPSGPRELKRSANPWPFLGKNFGFANVYEHPHAQSSKIFIDGTMNSWTSAAEFEIQHVDFKAGLLTQGVSSYGLVQQKRTLIQVQLERSPGENEIWFEHVGAECRVIPETGSPFTFEGFVPGKPLQRNSVLTVINQGVNFYPPPHLLNSKTYRFEITITNGPEEVLYLESCGPSGEFVKTIVPRILVVPILPGGGSPYAATFNRPEYDQALVQSRNNFMRIYPVSDVALVVGAPWAAADSLTDKYELDPGINLPTLRAFGHLAEIRDIWNQQHPDQPVTFVSGIFPHQMLQARSHGGMGLPPKPMIADLIRFGVLYTGVSPGVDALLNTIDIFIPGLGLVLKSALPAANVVLDEIVDFVLGHSSTSDVEYAGVVSLVSDGSDQTLSHEIGHNLGFVNPSAANHDRNNMSHSLYDGNPSGEDAHAPLGGPALGYYDVPDVTPPVFSLGETPFLFSGITNPASLMSYDTNSILFSKLFEPSEYNEIRRHFDVANYGNDAGKRKAVAKQSGLERLQIRGVFNLFSNTVEIISSRRLASDYSETEVITNSPMQIAFRDAGDNLISRSGFGYYLMPPFEGTNWVSAMLGMFTVVREISPGAKRVEILMTNQVRWSLEFSSAAPEVAIQTPAGGEIYAANDEVDIQWTGSDADGDALTYSIYYSADGGTNYTPLDVALATNAFHWATQFAAGSESGRIKVEASDGFNRGSAVSEPFQLAGKMATVMIQAPTNDTRCPESQPLTLSAIVLNPRTAQLEDGMTASFYWTSSADGFLGTGSPLMVNGLSPGTHQISVMGITTNGGPGEGGASVTVEVLIDRDGDGVADETELANGFDPVDPYDVGKDSDGDGITDGEEVLHFGSNPTNADSNGDGVLDGYSVVNGWDPNGDSEGTNDFDQDALNNTQEQEHGTNPHQADTDGDQMRDGDEVRAETLPTDPDSYLALCDMLPFPAGSSNWLLLWKGGTGTHYRITSAEGPGLPFTNVVASDRIGYGSETNAYFLRGTNLPPQQIFRIEVPAE